MVVALGLALVPRVSPGQVPADSARADSVRRARGDSARGRPATALAPVRVTALGGSLSPARVPYAVAISTPADAARVRSPIALDDALRTIPGLAVDNRYNIALGERITIRGFGARTQFGVRGVHVDVDGVPATMPDGQTTLSHVDPATVASSEVLRGPASSLYGNSAGGVVRLRTLSPFDLGDDVRVASTIAERGTVTTRASASGIAGSWGGALRASSLDYRGFREHSNARDLRTGGQLVHSAARDTVRLTIATVDYDADNPGGLTDSASIASPRSASATNLRYQTGEKGSHRQAGFEWRHSTDEWLVDASAWGLGRHLVNPIPQRIIDLQRRAAGARIAVERGAPGSAISFGAGLEHGSQWDDRRSFNSLDGARDVIQLDQSEDVESNGAFARAALTLGSAIDVLGSVRADRISFYVDDHLITSTDPDDGGTRTMSAVSPSLGVSWTVAPRYSLYANVATAFETPTTTELANRPDGAGGINPDLAPQHTVSTEAGVRAPLGSVGAATISVFDAHIRDALVPYELASTPGRQFYRNASRARQRGIEGSVSALFPSSLLARVAATLIDARFAATDSAAGLFTGRRIPGVAPFRTDVSITAGAGGPVRAELLATTQSRTPADDANSAWAPSFTVIDADVGLGPRAIGRLAVGASVALSNVFDRRYDTSVVPNAARARFFEPGPPRTATITVELSRHRPRR